MGWRAAAPPRAAGVPAPLWHQAGLGYSSRLQFTVGCPRHSSAKSGAGDPKHCLFRFVGRPRVQGQKNNPRTPIGALRRGPARHEWVRLM